MQEIGINILPLLNRNISGVGRVTYYLSKYIGELLEKNKGCKLEYLVLFRKLKSFDIKRKVGRYNFSIIKGILNKSQFYERLIFNFIDFTSRIVKIDTYLETNFVPLSYRSRKIISVVHDLSFFNPSFHPLSRVERFSRGFFKKTLKSDFIIVPSHFIKDEFCEKFPWVADRIKVIYHGIDNKIFFPEKNLSYKKGKSYILFVGNIEPRKNLLRLLKAYNLLPVKYKKEFPLFIVGRHGWKNEAVFSYIKENNLEEHVFIKRNIESDEDLASLYRGAYLFIYPSLYEGFGFPPLEAMASGCPVIVSNKGSLPEVCGDSALFIDPYDIGDIYEKLEFLIRNPEKREVLIRKGLDHVKKFVWEKTARRYINLLCSF